MWNWGPAGEANAIVNALRKSHAVIEFDLDGIILNANENFCHAMGYALPEIVGKHHSMFVEPSYAQSVAYSDFWAKLRRGESNRSQFKRVGKRGQTVWIEASYSPVMKGDKARKVIKIATDITASKLKSLEDAGKIAAISRTQAVIEFTPSGEILEANDNFLSALGYTLTEIRGRHHSMFCTPEDVRSAAYGDFWTQLAAGRFQRGEFRRVGKGGRQVWIQAAYNPIFDDSGRVFRVVKFATDITERVHAVQAVGQGLTRLAEGDLDQSIDQTFPSDLQTLKDDFNNSVCKLRHAMLSIGDNATVIATGATEMRTASAELASRTERQATSVSRTVTALGDISGRIIETASLAEEAGRLVSSTGDSAERSGAVVRQAIEAMGRIEQSSKEISNIIGVIDEIAFQTNLLALNAGVEAARAGDAGKGFAVVAQEVRELAQRSANAAKEIKTLIGKSGEQVNNGVSLVGRTGEALHDIVRQVENVNRNVTAIVQASRDQSEGLKEINSAVSTMDEGTQQNAAMVEQTNAAINGLASEVEALSTSLARFRIGRRASSTGMRPAAEGRKQTAAPAGDTKMARVVLAVGNNALAGAGENWEEF